MHMELERPAISGDLEMNRKLTFNCHEAAVLAKAALMAGLDHNEAVALRACATVRLCDPHDVLFEEADKAAYFY